MSRQIYLDCAASSPLAPSVVDHLTAQFKRNLGNASSIHRSGVTAAVELERARAKIAAKINASPEEIYFVSGATEGNNLVFKGLAEGAEAREKSEILISDLEHSSVSGVARQLEQKGFKIRTVPVNKRGLICTDELRKLVSKNTLLVSLVHVNSETGTIQDLHAIGDICAEANVYFHSDGAQAFCKTPVDMKQMKLHMYSLSAHKIHGPRGIGALYVSEKVKLVPQVFGGGQEGALRSGTTPVELISAMAKAIELFDEKALTYLKSLQDQVLHNLSQFCPNYRLHGDQDLRVPNLLNFALPGLEGKHALKKLDEKGIYISVGSACNSGKKNASATLKALGLSDEQAFEALRVSWGLETTREDIDDFLKELKRIYRADG